MDFHSIFKSIECSEAIKNSLGSYVSTFSDAGSDKSDSLGSFVQTFTNLFHHGSNVKILLLGEMILGATESDTQSGISYVVQELISCKVLPVIIGGERNTTMSIYKAFEEMESVVNITAVDPYLNIEGQSGSNYIGDIVKSQPNYLFNYSNLGFQTYLVNPNEIQLSDDLYFDIYRLGELRRNVILSEPIIRSTEIFTVSIEAIKNSDFSSAKNPQPNGFYAEEVCQMMRYAGLSEKLKAVLISDISNFKNASDELLVSEMLWCLIDGRSARKHELPNSRSESFLKYRVSIQDDEFQLVFYKSLKTDRWWMEVPVPPAYLDKYKKHHLIPCGYEDYQIAVQGDLPDRWWKAYKKML
jgi:formiminoglutamase